FQKTLKSLHPEISLLAPVEDHDVESEAYDKCSKLFSSHPDLAGIYVTTEASMPVVRAAQDAHVLDRLTIIATDLFPALIEQIRGGKVAATIYQRPHTQGRLACGAAGRSSRRSEEHTSELQSPYDLVCRRL